MRPGSERMLRVRECMELMRAMAYEPGVTCVELAGKWGCSLSLAQSISSEASRHVAMEINEPGVIGASVGQTLWRVLKAGKDGTEETKDVIAACALWAKLAPGVIAPTKLDVSVVDREKAAMDALPPKERAAALREIAAGLVAQAEEWEAEA